MTISRVNIDRMIKELKDGETHIFAKTLQEYDKFTDWLTEDCNAVFAYHFESGEAFRLENGIHIEVYGI